MCSFKESSNFEPVKVVGISSLAVPPWLTSVIRFVWPPGGAGYLVGSTTSTIITGSVGIFSIVCFSKSIVAR